MPYFVAAFDWDAGNRKKCLSHGLSVEEIEDFLRGNPRVAPDHKHSEVEKRFIAVGRVSRGRPIFVAFTLRERNGQLLVRPISARYMHRKEIERYEEEST